MFWVQMLIRVFVFGVALAYACKKVAQVKVEPRSALPLVAIVFTPLNAGLYWLLKGAVTVVSLWTLAIVAPFIANAGLLWATDRLLKPFKIEGIVPLVKTAAIITLAHFLLFVVEKIVV